MDRTQFPTRVHWAPSYIPDAAITRVLSNYCKVQSITAETSTAKGFEGIPTGIRRLVLTGYKDEVPHTFNIVNPVTGENYELLVIVPGRNPLCFKCKMTGHYRSECHAPSQTRIPRPFGGRRRRETWLRRRRRSTRTSVTRIETAEWRWLGGDPIQTVVSGVSGPGGEFFFP